MDTKRTNAAVLIVDDNIDIANGLARLLRIKKISSHCVYHGSDALAWLSHSRPGLVILDVNMPGVSGIAVLAQIKADPRLDGLPVVLHTALDPLQVMALAETCGADGVLLKGQYSFVDVLEVVEKFGVTPMPPEVAA